MRTRLSLAVLALSVIAASQPLPNMKVVVDDASTSFRGVFLYQNTYMVNVTGVFTAVSGGAATTTVQGDELTVSYNGKPWIKVPIKADGNATAKILDPASGQVLREVDLEEPPRWMTVKKVKTAMIDVDSLNELVGVSSDVVGDTLNLFTPRYWRRKLGLSLDLQQDALQRNAGLQPILAVTPPASTLLLSARGPKTGFAQIYKFEGGAPVPMLGKDLAGGNVSTLNPTAGDQPVSRAVTDVESAIGETTFTGKLPPFSYYVTIYTEKPFEGDVLEAIKAGKLGDDEWSVAGVRQRVTDSPISYAPYLVKTERSVESIAKEKDMSPDLLAAINNLDKARKVPAGRKVIVINGFNDDVLERQFNPKFKVVGLHVIQPGDTVDKLVKEWGATRDFFYAANPDVPQGAELDPGDIVNVVLLVNDPKEEPQKKQAVVYERATGRGLTKADIPLRKFTKPDAEVVTTIPARSSVVVMGRVAQLGLLKISYRDVEGYVPESSIRAPQGIKVESRGRAPVPTNIQYTGDPSKFAKEGMKYLGTPYKWGGNDPSRGIDCSHFVAQVYSRVGERTPSPPVHEMEQYGELTGWKQVSYHVGDRGQGTFSTSNPFDNLKPGDRIIMQNRPSGPNKSDHHIGIYLGSITTRQFGYQKHAMIHACGSQGVTIYDLSVKYANIYKYANRGSSKGRWYASISPGDIKDWAFRVIYGAKR